MINLHNFNPEILPSKSGRSTDHHKFITAAVLAAISMLVIGGLYWWMGQKKIVDVPVPLAVDSYRSATISQLEKPPQSQASSEQIKTIQKQISSNPKTTPTAEEKAAIIEKLNSGGRN